MVPCLLVLLYLSMLTLELPHSWLPSSSHPCNPGLAHLIALPVLPKDPPPAYNAQPSPPGWKTKSHQMSLIFLQICCEYTWRLLDITAYSQLQPSAPTIASPGKQGRWAGNQHGRTGSRLGERSAGAPARARPSAWQDSLGHWLPGVSTPVWLPPSPTGFGQRAVCFRVCLSVCV